MEEQPRWSPSSSTASPASPASRLVEPREEGESALIAVGAAPLRARTAGWPRQNTERSPRGGSCTSVARLRLRRRWAPNAGAAPRAGSRWGSSTASPKAPPGVGLPEGCAVLRPHPGGRAASPAVLSAPRSREPAWCEGKGLRRAGLRFGQSASQSPQPKGDPAGGTELRRRPLPKGSRSREDGGRPQPPCQGKTPSVRSIHPTQQNGAFPTLKRCMRRY